MGGGGSFFGNVDYETIYPGEKGRKMQQDHDQAEVLQSKLDDVPRGGFYAYEKKYWLLPLSERNSRILHAVRSYSETRQGFGFRIDGPGSIPCVMVDYQKGIPAKAKTFDPEAGLKKLHDEREKKGDNRLTLEYDQFPPVATYTLPKKHWSKFKNEDDGLVIKAEIERIENEAVADTVSADFNENAIDASVVLVKHDCKTNQIMQYTF